MPEITAASETLYTKVGSPMWTGETGPKRQPRISCGLARTYGKALDIPELQEIQENLDPSKWQRIRLLAKIKLPFNHDPAQAKTHNPGLPGNLTF